LKLQVETTRTADVAEARLIAATLEGEADTVCVLAGRRVEVNRNGRR